MLGGCISVAPVRVFDSVDASRATLKDVCERGGISHNCVESALQQLLGKTGETNTNRPCIDVRCVCVYSLPVPRERAVHVMSLFHGTKRQSVEEDVKSDGDGRGLFFSSSLLAALPYGRLTEGEDMYRVTLCRVARKAGSKLFSRIGASEEELRLFESVGGDLGRLNKILAEKNIGNAAVYDGVVDWLDDATSYHFHVDRVEIHTLLSADVNWHVN
ncbi:hypothetical protein ERJ75_001417200 [Trypanosoma vivax]|nr:hypothetical protein ERJ75_001417200 [Trypanosoma vivax]